MSWNHREIVDWLLRTGATLPNLDALIEGLGAEMRRAGAPVWRIRLAMRTIHPLAAAVSAIWNRDVAQVEAVHNPHGLEQRSGYVGSPLAVISDTRQALRKDLTRLAPDDHEIYHELRAQGATDYFGVPLRCGDHLSGILVAATDRAKGFDDADIEGIEAIALALGPLSEVHRLSILSTAVSAAYLGARTSQRVLGGEITRGSVETMEAAILISDIRNWTGLNARLPVEEAVALANRYFEAIDTAVTEHGGEILKFLGDGVLAVFPGDDGQRTACSNALAAARHALAADLPEVLGFGVGLHFGRVLYGNVGSHSRLDFTVLGQAVNVAARIEALCSETGHPVLCSRTFADALDGGHVAVGEFALKGLAHPEQVFAPKTTDKTLVDKGAN